MRENDNRKKNNPLVSIVVPAYNAEKYLESCIFSLMTQSYRNIEIVIVDDGSNDSTRAICETLKQKDNRVKIIVGKHEGANRARGLGVKKASGNYCMFVDSDDWIDPNSVDTLVKTAINEQCDIVKFNAVMEPSKRLKEPVITPPGNKCSLKGEDIHWILTTSNKLNNICFHFYSLNLLKKLDSFKFGISNCEDLLASLEIYDKADKMISIGDAFYHYRVNHNSTTKNTELSRNVQNAIEQIMVYSMLQDYAKKWGFDSEGRHHVAFLSFNKVRCGIYALFRSANISRKVFVATATRLSKMPEYNKIKKLIGGKANLERELANMGWFYRLKYSRGMRELYDDDFNALWKTALLYRLFYHVRQKIRGER